jgi:hypothetical protein
VNNGDACHALMAGLALAIKMVSDSIFADGEPFCIAGK